MRLKKIQIQGFKSFADKTTLEFGLGVTAVVGPNGCGKSNIADAFRWVLGEQSARSMRGLKMQDVIFEGSSKRAALNFAEVSITLSEIEGALPIQYEEVTVSRRLHRSGESIYLLNGQPVRLKDLQDLFADSGIGKNTLSIFEQGKIEQVINNTPLERRSIFWEAAGIIRFLQSKKEARTKLDDAEGNVSRLKDIHQEVENQIVVLREQAVKAAHFKEQKAQLEVIEKSLFVKRWDLLTVKICDLLEKENVKQKQLENAVVGTADLDQKLASAKEGLQASEQAYRRQSEELFKVRSDKEIKSREKQLSEERLKELHAKEKLWQQEINDLEIQKQKKAGELQESQKKQQEYEKELAILEAYRQNQKSKVQQVEAEVAKLREKQQLTHKENLELVRQEAQQQSELKQNFVRQENSRERQQHQSLRLEKLVQSEKELVIQCHEKQQQLTEVTQVIDEQRAAFHVLEKKVEEKLAAIQQRQKTIDILVQDMNEAKARHKVLMRLRTDMEGFSAATKKLLQASANAKSSLYGKLKGVFETISAEEEAHGAVAAVLSPYEQTLVVQNKEDFDIVLAFAAKEKLSDFSLLCLNQLEEPEKTAKVSLQAGEHTLISKVTGNSSSQKLLQHVYIVDDMKRAWELTAQYPSSSVFCKKAGFLDANGVFFQRSKEKSSVFLQEAEIKTLEIAIHAFEQQRFSAENELAALQQDRLKLHTEMMESDKTVRRSEMRLIELNFALQRANGEFEKNKKEQSQAKEEEQLLEATLKQLTASAFEIEARHAAIKLKKETLEAAVLALQEGNISALATSKAESSILQDHESAYQKAAKEYQQLLHSNNMIELKISESLKQEKRLSGEIAQAADLKVQFGKCGNELGSHLKELENHFLSATTLCKSLEEKIAAAKKSLEAIEKEALVQGNLVKKIESERQNLILSISQQESTQETLQKELEERYQLTMEQVRKQGPFSPLTIEECEKLLRSLRQQLESAGDINMTSIDECAKHQVRFEFLQNQMGDLEGARDDLLKIISELDAESIKLFKEAFNAIAANFRKNFSILFNGGEADLQLTGNADLLEAGIEIIARPPGKQMSSINLLSGGEKCLTAMALLFAIFETKAGPYCILDEIDAPLDDSNVDRFANVLRQFIDRCQFIVITHNKRTMAIADRLFGVSMEEKGVSKLLKMDFSHEQDREEGTVRTVTTVGTSSRGQ